MDFPQLRKELENKQFARFDSLQAEYENGDTTGSRRAEIAREMHLLIGDGAGGHTAPGGLRAWAIVGCLAVAVLACFLLVFWFFSPFGARAGQSQPTISEAITAASIILVACFGSAIICYRLLAGGVPRRAAGSTGAGLFSGPVLPFAMLVTILFFAGVALYLRAILPGDISSVRSTRPILVFTLIAAMLGFGGLLMVRSLFGGPSEDADALEKRFRLAREIFLVYSGIFGTIIGFYFGAADEAETGAPPAITLSAGSGTISAQITGGSPPFTGVLQRTDPPLDLLLQGGGRLLAVTLAGPATDQDDDGDGVPDHCGVGGTITVIDGRGRRASADVAGELFGEGDDCAVAGQAEGQSDATVPGNAQREAGSIAGS